MYVQVLYVITKCLTGCEGGEHWEMQASKLMASEDTCLKDAQMRSMFLIDTPSKRYEIRCVPKTQFDTWTRGKV